jgi:hypothetical protein
MENRKLVGSAGDGSILQESVDRNVIFRHLDAEKREPREVGRHRKSVADEGRFIGPMAETGHLRERKEVSRDGDHVPDYGLSRRSVTEDGKFQETALEVGKIRGSSDERYCEVFPENRRLHNREDVGSRGPNTQEERFRDPTMEQDGFREPIMKDKGFRDSSLENEDNDQPQAGFRFCID